MLYRGKKNAFFSTFWINFMECHSIQFTTISINVERGIVKILFKYQYFQDLLIDIDIDIDISQILLIDIDIDIDIFQKCRYIDNRYVISIYRIGLSSNEVNHLVRCYNCSKPLGDRVTWVGNFYYCVFVSTIVRAIEGPTCHLL